MLVHLGLHIADGDPPAVMIYETASLVGFLGGDTRIDDDDDG